VKENFFIDKNEIISIQEGEIMDSLLETKDVEEKNKFIIKEKKCDFSIKKIEKENIESLLKLEEALSKEGFLQITHPERINWLYENKKNTMTKEEEKEIKKIKSAQNYRETVNRANVIEQMKEALKKSEELENKPKDSYFKEVLSLGENEMKAIEIVKELKDINEIEKQWSELDNLSSKKIDTIKQNILEINFIEHYASKISQQKIREECLLLKEEGKKLELEVRRLEKNTPLFYQESKKLIDLEKKVKLLSDISIMEKGEKSYEENVSYLITNRKNNIKELMKAGKILKKDMDVDIIEQSISSYYKADLIKTLVSCPSEKITAILENLDFFRIMNKYTTNSYIKYGENYYVENQLYISDFIQTIKILTPVEAKEIKARKKAIMENQKIFFDTPKSMAYWTNTDLLKKLLNMPAEKIQGIAQSANKVSVETTQNFEEFLKKYEEKGKEEIN